MIKYSVLEKSMSYTKVVNTFIALFTRITIAGVFVFSGWGKLTNLDKTIEYFSSIGMPISYILAPFVGVVEFVCSLFVFIGFATRIAAIPLTSIMIVAILTAKLEEISGVSSLFEMTDFLYILLLVWLIAQGAGKISLDYYLIKKITSSQKISI